MGRGEGDWGGMGGSGAGRFYWFWFWFLAEIVAGVDTYRKYYVLSDCLQGNGVSSCGGRFESQTIIQKVIVWGVGWD